MVTMLGPPGKVPNSAPARCPRPPRRARGIPEAALSPPPRIPSTPEARGPRSWGSPRRGLGSSALSVGLLRTREPRSPPSSSLPNLTPSLLRKIRGLEGVPGTPWLSVPALPPRSPRPGTLELRTSDPLRLGGAGTGLTAAAAGRAEGGPRSLLLPPGGRGGKGDGPLVGAVGRPANCGPAATLAG